MLAPIRIPAVTVFRNGPIHGIKMQAAVEQFGKALALGEMNIPARLAGRILVKTEACAYAGSDGSNQPEWLSF